MRTVLSAILLALWLGCLSSPQPAQHDARTTDIDAPAGGTDATIAVGDAIADAGVDASGCVAEPSATGSAFPPAVLDVRTAASADLDGDCRLDMLVATASAEPGSQGVYVLLGRDGGEGKVYDSFLDTGDVLPVAVAARDLDGDQLGEVLVLGSDATNNAMLLLFRATGRGVYGSGRSLSLGGPAMYPQNGGYLAFGNLDGDAHADLLIARRLRTQHIDLFTLGPGFSSQLPVNVLPPEPYDWNEPLLGFFKRGDAEGFDDLIIVHPVFTYRYPNNSGAPAAAPDLAVFNGDGDYDSNPDDNLAGLGAAFIADMNQDGFPDVIGSGAADARLLLLDPTETINPYLFHLNDDQYVDEDDNLIDYLRLVDVDDDSTPSLLLANSLESFAGTSTVSLYTKARFQTDAPRWAATMTQATTILNTGVHPRGLITGDINGDGTTEAVVFPADGTAICFVVRAATGLTPCSP